MFVIGLNICIVDGRAYSFEVQLGSDSGSPTDGAIFFRLFGTNNIWSDWFTRSNFTTAGETYTWNQVIVPSVGNATKVVVLSQQTDGFTLNTITIDTTKSYTISNVPGADLDCSTTIGDPCSYVIIFFNGTDYIDHTRTYAGGGCDLDTNINPTPGPTSIPSIYPSIEPTLFPSSDPTDSPTTPTPTANPSVVPSKTPSNHPTKSPTYTPTQQPISPTDNPTFFPTGEPTDQVTMTPSKNPTFIPTNSYVTYIFSYLKLTFGLDICDFFCFCLFFILF